MTGSGQNSLLPPNATHVERAIEAATARLEDVATPLRSLWNPATCPPALLPWLAWALSIDTWSPDWTDATKRQRVAKAVAIQRRKGTVSAVRDVVAIFGGAVAIREWWQTTPAGVPHTFDVVLQVGAIGGAPPSAELIDDVVIEISRAKPARSHFTFALGLDAAARIGTKAVARAAIYVRLSATVSAAP